MNDERTWSGLDVIRMMAVTFSLSVFTFSSFSCTPDEGNEEDAMASAETGAECNNDNDCGEEDKPFCVAGVCESGEAGAACEFDNDCSMDAPICVMMQCTAGEVGDACEFDSDCLTEICAIDVCTEGNPGDPCEFPSDCNEMAPFCPDVDPKCSAGEEGDPCSFQSECQEGLSCEAEMCTA